MSDNPFEALKNLGNLGDSLKSMQGMQDKIKAIKEEGSAGGDMVKITMNGSMQVVQVHIDPEAVDPEDVDMLQSLIVAACNNARTKVEEKIQETMGPLASMMGQGSFGF